MPPISTGRNERVARPANLPSHCILGATLNVAGQTHARAVAASAKRTSGFSFVHLSVPNLSTKILTEFSSFDYQAC
jgi:hypothetical protein